MSGRNDFLSAARSLALPVDNEYDDDPLPTQDGISRRSNSPSWSRRSPGPPAALDTRPRTIQERWMRRARKLQAQYTKTWRRLSLLQQIGLSVAGIATLVLAILFLVYNEAIFARLSPAAKKWRELPAGWLILWVMTFGVAFPPMIGYSSCVTIAGFVFGLKGWFIVATATVVGSTTAFLVSRTVLRKFVSRLTEKNTRFAALSSVLKHDGLKLLFMIRVCPLPFSLSNGAISTIPSVTPLNFALATALASPKLLLHVFIGSRIGDLAENGNKMDARTKAVSYLSIIVGVVAGSATAYIVYVRTKARAAQLEAEEIAAGNVSGESNEVGADEADEREIGTPAFSRRAAPDDISLHTTYEDDLESGRAPNTYRDDFTDDEDAQERDVFDLGDGEDEGDEVDADRDDKR